MRHRWEKYIRNVMYPDPSLYAGFGRDGEKDFDEFVESQVRYYVHTRVPCSCMMCGNPRRWWGEPTRQEKLADWDLKLWELDNLQEELESLKLD